MPIKKRFGKFVKILPDGSVEVRTPADCTKWDHEFRLRVVRDYLPPKTLLDKNIFHRRFDEKRVYHIQGCKVLYQQPHQDIANMPNKFLVLRTEIVNIGTGKAMFLKHTEPVMRMLMVYSFLTGKQLPEVSLFDTYDWHGQ